MKSGLVVVVVAVIILVGGILLWQSGVFTNKAPEQGETISVPLPPPVESAISFTPPAPVTETIASNPPETTERTPAYLGEESYTVKKGDTLWEISKRFYGKGEKYKIIEEANRDKISDASKIKIGMVLLIPKTDSFVSPSSYVAEPAKPKIKYHTVKRGDNLKKIAQRYYKDSTKSDLIFDANRNKLATPETTLKQGWKLVIPPEGDSIPQPEQPVTPSGTPE